MAEAFFKKMFHEISGNDCNVEIASSGLYAANGEPATELAKEVMNEAGIDISSHRSTRFTKAMFEKADLVLTMATTHLETIYKQWPILAQKRVFLLKAFIRNISVSESLTHNHSSIAELNIKDPFGGTKSDYEVCFNTIKEELEKGFQQIMEFLNIKINTDRHINNKTI